VPSEDEIENNKRTLSMTKHLPGSCAAVVPGDLFGRFLPFLTIGPIAVDPSAMLEKKRKDIPVNSLRRWSVLFGCLLVLGWHRNASAAGPAPQIAIGQPAVLPPPPDSQWQTALNFLPANGDTVTLNPPQFQWCYTTNFLALTTDSECKTFIFQIAYDSGFNNLAVNVTTLWNFYNALPPLTQSTCYWRIGYVHGISFTNGLMGANPTNGVYYWSPTYTFTIAPSAVVWDRSLLANQSYLASKAAHPHMLMNSTNSASIQSWLNMTVSQYNANTTNLLLREWGKGYNTIKGEAANQVAQSYWPSNLPPSSGLYNWAWYNQDVAFMWAITQSPTWSNTHPEVAITLLASNYIASGNYAVDMINSGTAEVQTRALALGYDWCYSLFTPIQRSNVLYALALHCNWIMCNEQYGPVWMQANGMGYGAGDPTGLYSNGIYRATGTSAASLADFGHSHGSDNFNTSMMAALAGYNESPWCSNLFQMGVNYLTGPSYTYRRELGSGRPYTMVHFGSTRQVTVFPTLAITFPEVGWTNNPYLTEIMDWWDHVEPVGFAEYHEPWGDTGLGFLNDWPNGGFWQMAVMMQNGRWLEHWWNAETFLESLNHGANVPDANTMTIGYYFDNASALPMSPTTNCAVAYTNEGWVISSSLSPSTFAGFNNGVNLYFQARPNGGTAGHTYMSDGSFQIQAYGANVTDAGAGAILGDAHASWAHQSLTINGLGQDEPGQWQSEPYYAYISAYTNSGTNFTYMAADLTRSYAHYNLGNFGVGADNSLDGVGSLVYATNVTRQILFNHGSYFVIYDTLQTANPPTNVFSWIYRVFPTNMVLDTTNMTFSYTAANYWNGNYNYATKSYLGGSNVPVYVSFVNAPSELTVTNLTGTSASMNYQINPITGENYWTYGAPGDAAPQPSSVLWFNNAVPTNNFHFMVVIYPVPPGGSVPTITRLDDDTVLVDNGSVRDVVCFNPNSTNAAAATFLVNSPAIVGSGGEPIVQNPGMVPPGNSSGSSSAGGGTTSGGAATTSAGGGTTPTQAAVNPPANLRIMIPYNTNQILPGYWAWWNPDTIHGTNGSPVAAWKESSPAGRSAVQTTPADRPTLGVASQNGHNTVSFNGVTSFLSLSSNSVTLPQPIEVFTVLQPNNLTSEAVAFGNQFSSDYFMCAYLGSSHNYGGYAGSYIGNNVTGTTQWAEATFIFNGTNSQFFVNGVSISTGSPGPNGMNGLVIGCFQNLSEAFWNGQIGDIIIYTNILSAVNQQTVENALHSKYGF